MTNSDAYHHGLTGRAKRNPYPAGTSEWRCWNLGKAGRARTRRAPAKKSTIKTLKRNPSPARPKRARARRPAQTVGPYYVVKAGKRIYHRTIAAAAKFAQSVADKLGKPVPVHQAKRATKTARAPRR